MCGSAGIILAASTPTLALTSSSSGVNIAVTGASPNATVIFNYLIDPTQTSSAYTAIDIGQTDAGGSFNVSVAQNSYGLNSGSSVYVSVYGATSSHMIWPASANYSSSSGNNLVLSQQNITLTIGQSANVVAMNAVGTLSIANNTNTKVATISIQNGSVFFVNALAVGSTVATLCVSSNGCGTLNITVQAPTQAVSFSQVQANVVVGQSPQTINIYGSGTYYGLTNSNQNVISASIDGSNLVLTGLAVGKAVVSLCATGWQCGSITVNSLSSGSAIPTAVTAPAPSYSNQPPQISSISMSSNNVYGLFFGVGSTLNISFSADQGITNVAVKIAGAQAAVNAGSGGLYTAAYTFNGKEVLPIPVVITFANSSGQVGQHYFWLGNSATLPVNTNITQTVNQSADQSGSISLTFSKALRVGMTSSGVSDPEVTALQQRLKTDKFYSGPITGYFGPLTKSALEAYQKKNGLSPIGSVGPATRALLNKGI